MIDKTTDSKKLISLVITNVLSYLTILMNGKKLDNNWKTNEMKGSVGIIVLLIGYTEIDIKLVFRIY